MFWARLTSLMGINVFTFFALFAFFVTPVSTLANGKRPYPTNSTGRPIGCDSAHDGQMQISRSYSFWETQTKLFYRICYLGTACAATTSIIPPTLKQVHSRISVTGGAFFRATKGALAKLYHFLGEASLYCHCVVTPR